MTELSFLLWNMEWMNDLFVSNDEPPAFRPDDYEPAHHRGATVRQRRDHLSGALNELAADVVVVVEGPNRAGELQLFFDEDVEGNWETWVQPSKGSAQCVGVAVRTDQNKFEDPPFEPFDTNGIEVFGGFFADADDDGIDENYAFERKPLYVQINPKDGKSFRILGLHLKSKGIFGAYEWSKWWQIADANRRKILAQASQIRLRFLDPYMTDSATREIPLIVCGDINDGPGLDASEKRLFGSGIERLMGTVWRPELCLHNALFDSLKDEEQAELEFDAIATTSFQDPIFNFTWHREWIDHVLYTESPDEPWVVNAEVHELMPDGTPIWKKYEYASDHFPVSAAVTTAESVPEVTVDNETTEATMEAYTWVGPHHFGEPPAGHLVLRDLSSNEENLNSAVMTLDLYITDSISARGIFLGPTEPGSSSIPCTTALVVDERARRNIESSVRQNIRQENVHPALTQPLSSLAEPFETTVQYRDFPDIKIVVDPPDPETNLLTGLFRNEEHDDNVAFYYYAYDADSTTLLSIVINQQNIWYEEGNSYVPLRGYAKACREEAAKHCGGADRVKAYQAEKRWFRTKCSGFQCKQTSATV